jgi:hypothetical protein
MVLFVLINIFAPLISYTNKKVTDLYMPSGFKKYERAQSAFSMLTGFESVPAEILNKPLQHDDWINLPHCVKKDIDYWRPYTVGEVMFNDWD